MTDSREGSLRALEHAVDAAARAWVDSFATALSAEGRRVAGGWPGTISEARYWVSRCASTGEQTSFRVTPSELDQLTRRAYVVARKAWLLRAECAREADSDGGELNGV